MSDSLWPHARLPCSSPAPGIYPNSCPLSRWCHLAISSSVIPFSSCLQSFPTSGSFQMRQLFASGGQSIGVSASTSVLPMNTGLISLRMDWLDLLAVQGTLKSLLKINQYHFMINHNQPTKYLLSHFSWRNESIERERHYLKLLIYWLSAAGFELKNYGNFCFYEVYYFGEK